MGTVAIVQSYPDCDIHRYRQNQSIEARYDGRTIMGPWAYMCKECFTLFGVGLGTGRGQRLMLVTDV